MIAQPRMQVAHWYQPNTRHTVTITVLSIPSLQMSQILRRPSFRLSSLKSKYKTYSIDQKKRIESRSG